METTTNQNPLDMGQEQVKEDDMNKINDEIDAQTDMEYSNISVSHYLSLAVLLAEEGGKIIRAVNDSGDLMQKNKNDLDKDKGEIDPVTIADITVQKTIEECFKFYFPSLKVEGEESKESMEGIQSKTNPSSLSMDFIDNELLEKTLESRYAFNKAMLAVYGDDIHDKFEEFNTKDAVVWVDPLDGTTEFVNGNLSGVTVLIGLAIKGVPKIGVVHNPYMTNEANSNGMTIFGT